MGNHIKIDIRETSLDIVEWTKLAHDRVQWQATVNKAIQFLCH
jgi:hypothetical protein